MKVFEFEFEFELYAVFHLDGRMDCMAQLNARCSALHWLCSALHSVRCMVSVVLALPTVAWSALYWLCPPLSGQRCTGSAHRYVVSVVMALPSVAQCALRGQRCTGSAQCCTMYVAWSALYWLCPALHNGRCMVSVAYRCTLCTLSLIHI